MNNKTKKPFYFKKKDIRKQNFYKQYSKNKNLKGKPALFSIGDIKNKQSNSNQIYVKFINSKKQYNTDQTDTTNIFDTTIFDKLKIDTTRITNGQKNNYYVMGYLKTLSTLNNDLETILTNDSLTLDQKQRNLEKLAQKNQLFDMELQYNVPKILSELITKLDLILLNPDNLQNADISPYMTTSLALKIGNHLKVKKSYRTPDVINTINILKDILQVFNHMNYSFGLFLVYHLIGVLRADYNNVKLKKKIEEGDSIQRKVFLNPESEKDSEPTVNIKRVELVEKFGKKLIESFVHLKNACLHDLRQKSKIKDLDTLNEEEQFVKICETLKSTHPEKLELFKILHEKYENYQSKIELLEVMRLGGYCVSVLEAINVLVDNGFIDNESKKDYKTSSKITIDKTYAEEIFSIPSRPKNLPMIVRPTFWKKSKKTEKGNLNYGGYLFNKILNYPAILNQHKRGVTVITDDDLENVNYIQSNYYKINKPFFEYVELNFKDVVKQYFKNVSMDLTHFIVNSEDKIILKPINDLFEADYPLADLKAELASATAKKKIKKLTYAIQKHQERVLQEYQDIVNMFFSLVHAYILAHNYKNFDFYFTVFLDNRGRLYYRTSGATFGLQSGDFSKSLIDLAGNTYNYNNNIVHQVKYPTTHKAYLDYSESLDEKKEAFQRTRVEKKMLPTTISNDASCSGTSILSGLIGYKKGLSLTNVFVETEKSDEAKQSVYTIFLCAMRDDYPVNARKLYSAENLAKKSKELKTTQKNFIAIADFGLILIKQTLLQREHAKQFVMRKNYSETNDGRLGYIYDYILKKAYYLSNDIKSDIDYQVYKSLCYYLAEWVESLYYKLFPEISELCDVLVKHLADKNPITLSCPNNSHFEYQQLLSKTFQISRMSYQKKRKSMVSVHVQTDEPDYKKIERSVVANFTHYLDARLNFSVIHKCRLDSILLWTNHDCFYVCPTQKSKLLKHYYNSFLELLVRDDVLKHFLTENNVDIANDKFLTNLLNNYDKNRKIILKELKNRNLVMSKFILSS